MYYTEIAKYHCTEIETLDACFQCTFLCRFYFSPLVNQSVTVNP